MDRFAVADLDVALYAPGRLVPPAIEALCEAVARSSAMIWSSPLYHGSVSGSFKNAIDWLQVLYDRGAPYLDGKVIGLIGTAAGVHALQAINTMEFMVRALRGLALPGVVPILRAGHVFGADGAIAEPSVAAQLDALGRAVVTGTRVLLLGASVDRRLESRASAGS